MTSRRGKRTERGELKARLAGAGRRDFRVTRLGEKSLRR